MNGYTLTQIRTNLGISQERLADILRVSALQLMAWETGMQQIPAVYAQTVERLGAHGLGIFGNQH